MSNPSKNSTDNIPCLLCYEMSSTLLKLRHYGFYVLGYGAHILQVYSVMAGWIVEILFMLSFAYIAV